MTVEHIEPAPQPQIREVALQSNNLYFSAEPAEGDIVEQRLVITADGHVRFSSFGYSRGTCQLADARQAHIRRDDAQRILGFIQTFVDQDAPRRAPGSGTWEMTIRYADETERECEGALANGAHVGDVNLSHLIRNAIPIPNLMAFGGR
jgi:hypothetical protein